MLSRLVVACPRSCVCFEFELGLNVKFIVDSWKDTSFVLVGNCTVVAQCLVVDWCTNTCRVARLIVFISSHLIITFDSRLVCVLLSFVGGRLVELVVGHPRPSSVEALVYRGCLCRDPPVCRRVQDDSVAKRQPFFVVVGVVTSKLMCN